MSGEMTVPTSAADFKKKRGSFIVKVNDDLTVRLRRLDMPSLLMEGVIPLEMFAAAQHFADLQAVVDGAKSEAEVVAAVGQHDKGKFLEFLRKYAVVATMEPRIVEYLPDEAEDAIYVKELGTVDLLVIWNANPPGGEPLVKPEVAAEFRGAEPQPADPVVPAGEDIRPEAVVVDPAAIQTEDDVRVGIRA